MPKQFFIAIIQTIFIISLSYQVIIDSDNIEIKGNERNILFAVIILYLTSSKIIASLKVLRFDIEILAKYFHMNHVNLFLNISTNVFIALMILIITFLIILPLDNITDIVLNSTAIIFVVDLDDEATEEIYYDIWFKTSNRNFQTLFRNNFGLRDKYFDSHDKLSKLNTKLNDFWCEIKNDVSTNKNLFNEIVLLFMLALQLIYIIHQIYYIG